MKFKLFATLTFSIIVTGCLSNANPIIERPTRIKSTKIIDRATPLFIPTQTTIPFSTPKPSMTPMSSATLLPEHQIWDAGSVPDYYAVQYPENKWLENQNTLIHKEMEKCSLGSGGGSDICMSGGCVTSKVILGEVEFGKTVVYDRTVIYSSYPINIHLFYQAWLGDNPSKCMRDVESVLDTIQLRPNRGCTDRATFVTDTTIPDNTKIPAGASFIKTWRIKNTGTCTWTKNYTLLVIGKSSGTRSDWISLSQEVRPQETIDLSIELSAPKVQGTAKWEATIQNELGDWFGVGLAPYTEMFGKPFWVQIVVVPE